MPKRVEKACTQKGSLESSPDATEGKRSVGISREEKLQGAANMISTSLVTSSKEKYGSYIIPHGRQIYNLAFVATLAIDKSSVFFA